MRAQADASFQRIDKKNERNEKSDGDFHSLMAKVESVSKNAQKRTKTNSRINQTKVARERFSL
jgi:hypothetical protein